MNLQGSPPPYFGSMGMILAQMKVVHFHYCKSKASVHAEERGGRAGPFLLVATIPAFCG